MPAALLNEDGFRRAIEALIAEAKKSSRVEDLDRVVAHVKSTQRPDEVSELAALMFLLDEEFRLPLQEAIDAYRRWHEKKETPIEDSTIMTVLHRIYAA